MNEQLHMQIAEMSILARIKQSQEGEEDNESILEKYYETRRELETLRQRVASEFEDQIESLESSKRSLEKKVSRNSFLRKVRKVFHWLYLTAC